LGEEKEDPMVRKRIAVRLFLRKYVRLEISVAAEKMLIDNKASASASPLLGSDISDFRLS
jgi:hypothetical protein